MAERSEPVKLWDKGAAADTEIDLFTAGDDPRLDLQLIPCDCLASQAHAEMLEKAGVLSTAEKDAICSELQKISRLAQAGELSILPSNEDGHTEIENRLTEALGETGKKIHTFRSRNDQAATALRLYYKTQLTETLGLARDLLETIWMFGQRYRDVKLPGFTHTRKAMPSSLALWCGAFIESLDDNINLLDTVLHVLVDRSPLGSGAGYGVPAAVHRHFSAQRMGFPAIQANPLYVQNSRGKLEAAILHALTQFHFDLNKIASDIIFFSLPELGYFQLPPHLCTGSSMMPHKLNPDPLELVRGYYHRLCSLEFQVKGLAANLISGYHRDLQLTKGPVMEGIAIIRECLRIVQKVFRELRVNRLACRKAMTAELYTVQKACQRVRNGMSFREAYRAEAGEYFAKRPKSSGSFRIRPRSAVRRWKYYPPQPRRHHATPCQGPDHA